MIFPYQVFPVKATNIGADYYKHSTNARHLSVPGLLQDQKGDCCRGNRKKNGTAA
jgi:hypothetical protein